MPNALLRLPSPAFPNDLASGDARIDAHLRALDAALAGAASVRRRTLLEAREFLLDMRDQAREAGRDDASAADEAIAAFGPIESIAREQRATLAATFRRCALGMGLGYAGMMLLFELLRTGMADARWGILALVFAAQAVLFGLPMGYLVAYVFKRAEPSLRDTTAADGGFLVRFAPGSIALSWGLAVAFSVSAVIISAGLAGIGPFATWQPAFAVALLLVNLRLIVGALRAARFRAHAGPETLAIDGLFGRTRIPRAGVTGTGRAAAWMQLLIPALGLSHWIAWRDASGRARRTYVSIAQDLVHGDRLLAWLEAAARANAGHATLARSGA